MKNLILAATVAVTAFSAAESSAGCRIRPVQPPAHCEVGPVYRPVRTCQITLPPPPPVCHVRPVCPPEPVCHIRPVCPPEPICQIRPCVVTPVCELPPPPTCTIRPCEPQCHCKRECTCHQPVQPVCRIRCVEPEPAPPVYPEQPLPEIQTGQEVTIDGAGFGFQPGRVIVQIGGLQLQAQVLDWSNEQVRAAMPNLPLTSATDVTVVVLGADGQVANELTAQLIPALPIPAAQAVAQR